MSAAESLRAEVGAAVRDRRLGTIDELGEEAVLWLAVAPVWTLAAAEAAGFPASGVTEFVRRACDAGWGKARGSLLGDRSADLVFWMPDAVRREAVDALRDRHGSEWVAENQQRIAAMVASVAYQWAPPTTGTEPPEDLLPRAMIAWADLMTGSVLPAFSPAPGDSSGGARQPASPGDLMSGADVGSVLVTRTQRAVAARDLSYAQDLVSAGEAIAGVLAGTTEQALSRARRLLALGRRRRQDQRALARYLDRPELSGAVAGLFGRDSPGARRPAVPAPAWALHLRGVGGVGKTMLITYLASGRYAADRGWPPIPIARADFDHISPDYPVRRPVQLLLELADELALHTAAADKADRALLAFRARAATAHEAVSGLREAGGSPLRHAAVARAVDRFGDALYELGDVLLILDTCEELAKADMGDPAGPAVRATLEIIERLHERAPQARVLFAGRRPLPERAYLTVQPVAGFTVDESRRYLAANARPLGAGLAGEMIRQSPAVDGPVPAAGQLPERVSPFDLALYAAWADEDPSLDVAQVSQGSDAYVEGRIIERLEDPLVVRALPVLASGGRCRVETIAPLLACDPATLGQRLAQQEWTDADGDPPVHVAARPALASRLRRYFGADERRAEFAAGNAALAAVLAARVREVPLAEIDADELIAALRLAEPADAAALWDSLADRATEPPGRWGTIGNLTRRILGEWDEEEWPTTRALRATVTAAHIAAGRRDSALFDARRPWETVLACADDHPRAVSGRQLRVRAALGLLPYTPDDGSLWDLLDPVLIKPGGPTPAGVRAGSASDATSVAVADVAYRLLEAGLDDAADRLGPALQLILLSPDGPVTRVRAWATMVEARRLAGRHRPLDGLRPDIAGLMARLAVARDTADPAWPDWVPPEDLIARLCIEWGLIAPPGDPATFALWETIAADNLGTIDGERLASLCLRVRLRHGPVDEPVAERWEALDGYVPDRVPTCSAHDLVPPLCVSVAQAWLSAGRPERALAFLDRRRGEALGTRQDDATVRLSDVATVDIVRRLRMDDRRSLITRLADGRQAEDLDGVGQAMRAQAVIGGFRKSGAVELFMSRPERWHVWWQSLRQQELAALPRPSAVETWAPALSSLVVADVRADLQEVQGLSLGTRFTPSVALAAWAYPLGRWLDRQDAPPPAARTAEPHQALRAEIRLAVLYGQPATMPAGVPARLFAELAFEEAELLELRLPLPAIRLFEAAMDAYTDCDDAIGVLLCALSLMRVHSGADGEFDEQDKRLVSVALAKVRVRYPDLAATLTGPPGEAGPWLYWTSLWRTALVKQPSEATSASPASAIPDAGHEVLAALEPGEAPPPPARGSLGRAARALLRPLVSRKVASLARGQGVGAARLSTLLFEAWTDGGPFGTPGLPFLRVGLRPEQTAPPRARARLFLLGPAVWLAGQDNRNDGGYTSTLAPASRPWRFWWRSPRPEASAKWWLRGRGTALGVIRTLALTGAAEAGAWERDLAGSMHPDAAGRIEWIRLVGEHRPAAADDGTEAELVAPTAWVRSLRGNYSMPPRDAAGVALRHVIGTAVATSAGPVMEVVDATAPGTRAGDIPPLAPPQLLGPLELAAGQPAIVVLQAEPAPGATVGTEAPDDQAEKLELGAALSADGVPAVLLLPVLPDTIATQVAEIVTGHLKGRLDRSPQFLLTRLRGVIAPHVAPPVLDDVVLFLHADRYRP